MRRPGRMRAVRALVCALLASRIAGAAAGARDVAVADAAERGDAAAVRGAAQEGRRREHRAGRRHDGAPLGGDERRPAAGHDRCSGPAPTRRATTRIGGYTPLMLAARHGHGAVVEALLAAGADAKTTTDNGTTPLMFAGAVGRVASVEALRRARCDLNAREIDARARTRRCLRRPPNRAAVITRARAATGADLGRDLRAAGPARHRSHAFEGVLFGNPAPPKTPGGAAGSVEGGGGRAQRRRPTARAAARSPAWTATSRQRAGEHAGRHDAAALRRAAGLHRDRARRCSTRASTSTRRRPATTPRRC